MDIKTIIYSAISIGGMGITFGIILGLASKKFAVEVDPTVEKINDALPGSNCGGCGYAGCNALAKAIASGEAGYDACPAGGSEAGAKIADIMGVEAIVADKKVAYVKCKGTCDNVKDKLIYDGVKDCNVAIQIPGQGHKACIYGCLGFGSCAKVCNFGAIKNVDGIVEIDEDKCTSCGMCVLACPKNLIDIVPAKSKVRVQCNSRDKGKDVKAACKVGCIGCRLCTKVCAANAIIVENNIATIDYEKCTQCNACVEKCPVKIIEG